MPIEPGQTLLHYRIVDKLGEGGMRAVWRAEDTRLGREVAIKVMPAELAGDDEAIRWNHKAHQRDPSARDPLFNLAALYLILDDEVSGQLWLARLGEVEESGRSVGVARAFGHARRGELAQFEATARTLVAIVSDPDPSVQFILDLIAGNHDAILEREEEQHPGLLEDPPEVVPGNVRAAQRVGAALAGRGDPRAEQVLGKCEEFLEGLDERTRRASFPDLLGRVYLHQGRHDEALAEWRIDFENGWRDLLFYISPEFDPVRDDPRFRALVDDTRADFDRQRRALAREGLASAEP